VIDLDEFMDTDHNKNTFAFVLGRESELALLEVKAVLGRFGFGFCISSVSDNIAIIKFEEAGSLQMTADSLISSLGGTTKIFELYKKASPDLKKEIIDMVIAEKSENGSKIDFGISNFSKRTLNINKLGIEVKTALKPQIKSRFVAIKEGQELSTIVSQTNKLDGKGVEVGVFDEYLGRLIAISNPFEWSKRDYGKPAGDKYSGMLPPKLARMMVNLSIGESNDKSIVVDPFCGSGNIPIEALMLGHDIIASDISEKAVMDTKLNIEWVIARNEMTKQSIKKIAAPSGLAMTGKTFSIFQADATKHDFLAPLSTLDLELSTRDVIIVAEPYLGEPKKFKPSKNAVLGEFKKLEGIYLGFLKNLASLLRASSCQLSAVCLVFPLVESSDGGQISLFAASVDEIEKMGYTLLRPPLVYGRDYQVVKREILFLQAPKS